MQSSADAQIQKKMMQNYLKYIVCTIATGVLITWGIHAFEGQAVPMPQASASPPSGGCGVITKAWIEQKGGGGSFLNRAPMYSEYHLAVRYKSGGSDTFLVDENEFGAFKEGDPITVSWAKRKWAMGEEGEYWAPTRKYGCD
ncbi:hypothetical protein [Acetobacter sp.]|uniref:hypothetical protein n=1 Tax=Acetobacter sp. TaxID=440 RepID=UPI0039E86DCA